MFKLLGKPKGSDLISRRNMYIYGRIFIFSMKNSLKVTIGNTMNIFDILYLLLTQISAKNQFFSSKFKKKSKTLGNI